MKFFLLITVRYKQYKMVTHANRHKIGIHENGESHTSIVDVCVGKVPFGLDFRCAGVNAKHGCVQCYKSASHMFWELIQTVLSQHERINSQFRPLSAFMNKNITLHRCDDG